MAGSSLPKRFGDHIRELRQARSLTQQELAEQSALSVDAIRRIERGVLSPSLDTLQKLSRGLRLSLSTLFQGMDAESRDEVAELCDYLGHLGEEELETAWRVIQAMFEGAPQGS